jgi:hypothetical protein
VRGLNRGDCMRGMIELKKKRLKELKSELKRHKPNSLQYQYVKEQMDYVLADIFELQKERESAALD